MLKISDTQTNPLAQRAAWGAAVTAVCVLSTLALACATPFAGLAVMAAIFLPRREAFALMGINWLANQAIGFGLLHYPLTWSCFDGGINLGVAAMASVGASILVYRPFQKFGNALAVVGTLATAFVVNEGVLYITAMGHFEGDFRAPVVMYMLYLNGLALAGLLALQAVATAVGIVVPRVELGGKAVRAS